MNHTLWVVILEQFFAPKDTEICMKKNQGQEQLVGTSKWTHNWRWIMETLIEIPGPRREDIRPGLPVCRVGNCRPRRRAPSPAEAEGVMRVADIEVSSPTWCWKIRNALITQTPRTAEVLNSFHVGLSCDAECHLGSRLGSHITTTDTTEPEMVPKIRWDYTSVMVKEDSVASGPDSCHWYRDSKSE